MSLYYDTKQKYYGPIKYAASLNGVTINDLDDIMMGQGNKEFIDAEPGKYNLSKREICFEKVLDSNLSSVVAALSDENTYHYNMLHSACHIGATLAHTPVDEIKMVGAERGLLNLTASKFVILKSMQENSKLNIPLTKEDHIDEIGNEFNHLKHVYDDFYNVKMNFNLQIIKPAPKENEFAISPYDYIKAYADMKIISAKIEMDKNCKIDNLLLSEMPNLKASLFILTPSEERLSHAIVTENEYSCQTPFSKLQIFQIRNAVSREQDLLLNVITKPYGMFY